MQKFVFALAALLIFQKSQAQPLPYQNPALPTEQRVQDLLARMTAEEKFWQVFMVYGNFEAGQETQCPHGIFGFKVSGAAKTNNPNEQIPGQRPNQTTPELARRTNQIQRFFVEKTRLGIPALFFDEALHGLIERGATVFPQSIGLAATFDTSLMRQIATAIARETRVRGIRDVLSPVVNLATDPRWGRTEESYGEDPLLVAAMATAFVQAFENQGVITTPKHFAANFGDGGRDSYPVHATERFLEETIFPPFKACVQTGGSRSIMTAYNSLDGIPCSANAWLLEKKLKHDWGFRGFTISDANAVGGSVVLHNTARDYAESGAQALNNGLDVIFQTELEHAKLFKPAFDSGQVLPEKLDSAVARVLRAKFELGLFEQPYVDESAAENLPDSRPLAREAARQSLVLLKNEGAVLPFKKSVKRIAVLGEEATAARLGGYSAPCERAVSILAGLRERAGDSVKIVFEKGTAFAKASAGKAGEQTIPASQLFSEKNGQTTPGLRGEYFQNLDLAGQPTFERTDENLDFSCTLFSPDPRLAADNYSIRWTGKLKAPETGHFKIGLEGDMGFRLFVDGKLLVDCWQKNSFDTRLAEFDFQKGKAYDLRVEFFESIGNARIRLVWSVGVADNFKQDLKKAVAAARVSDIAIIVVGIHEGEFQDRASLDLPGQQEALIHAVAATGKPTVVLLVGGSAVDMKNWLGEVAAVMAVWYPGEQGGAAVAEALFGDFSPGGRLPISFPLDEAQLPMPYHHLPTGRGDDYHNLSGLPLFPFGFGLSYTQFRYSDFAFDKNEIEAGQSTSVRCRVTNVGDRAGDEVVQLYLRDILASVARPVLELKGFQRITLRPGESREVSFKLGFEELKLLGADLRWRVEPGEFRMMIGSSSRELWLKGTLRVGGG